MTTTHDSLDARAANSCDPPVRRTPPPMPSPALRARVLAAVDGVLAADAGEPTDASSPATWIAVAAALVAGLLLPPWLPAADMLQSQSPPPASLSLRARTAGIAEQLPTADIPASPPRLASSPPGVDDGRLDPLALTPFDLRSLLQGDL